MIMIRAPALSSAKESPDGEPFQGGGADLCRVRIEKMPRGRVRGPQMMPGPVGPHQSARGVCIGVDQYMADFMGNGEGEDPVRLDTCSVRDRIDAIDIYGSEEWQGVRC